MKKKIIILIIAIILLTTYLILGSKFNIYIECPILKITKLYCPGCGITRMLKSIITLDFYQAFRYNTLIFCLLPLFLVYIILEIRYIITKKTNFLNNKKYDKYWMTILIITILFGILRNTEMFSFLRPIKL